MALASSRGNASDAPEQQRAAAAPLRNDGAAQEGMRQRDVRQSQPRAFRPHRDTGMRDAPSKSAGDGLYNGLVEQVAARRKPPNQNRSLFPVRG